MTNTPQNEEKSAATQQQTKASAKPIVGPPTAAIPEKPPTEVENCSAKKKRKWTNDPGIFWLTFAGLVVLGIYTYYTRQLVIDAEGVSKEQFKLTRDQLALARKSNITANRAWIAPMNAILIDGPVKDVPLKLEIQWANVGREPAFDVRPTYIIKPIEFSHFLDNTIKEIVEQDDICRDVLTAPGADVAYPNQPTGYKINFSTPFIFNDALSSGTSALVVEMCFAYRTMDEPHHTAFCYFYRVGTSSEKQLNICTFGNRAD